MISELETFENILIKLKNIEAELACVINEHKTRHVSKDHDGVYSDIKKAGTMFN